MEKTSFHEIERYSQMVIITYYNYPALNSSSETNNSDGSDIGILFISSRKVVFLIFPIHTTSQTQIIKKC
jgi:hypothetical protein